MVESNAAQIKTLGSSLPKRLYITVLSGNIPSTRCAMKNSRYNKDSEPIVNIQPSNTPRTCMFIPLVMTAELFIIYVYHNQIHHE
jgi:hypothetical protein